jgi:hypothetical protein
LLRDEDRFNLLTEKIRGYAQRNGLVVDDSFASRFRDYYLFILKNQTRIEGAIGSELTLQGVTFALWSIGLSSVSIAIGERRDRLGRDNLEEAINRAKEDVKIGSKERFVQLCPLPTCWEAAASMIKIGRSLFDHRSDPLKA